jgi:hypothetical protein
MQADDQLAALDILLDGKIGGAKQVAMELKGSGRTTEVLSRDTIIRAARRRDAPKGQASPPLPKGPVESDKCGPRKVGRERPTPSGAWNSA